jgi:DNA modification methylase
MIGMAKLALAKIRTDGGTQPRASLNAIVVDDYADDMKRGDKFPAIDVFYDGENYWLSRGNHRLAARRQIGARDIEANIHQGTLRDAILFGVGDNASHGLRRTNDDKTRCVTTLLNDAEWRKWSDRKIAELCQVSQPFVSKLRKVASDNGYQIDRLAERNGKTFTMNVGRINGKAGEVVKAARDLIRETPLADDPEFIHKLGLVNPNQQVAVAKIIANGERKTIGQAKRMIERQAKAAEWKKVASGIELLDEDCTIHVGDCRDVLADIPDRSIDLVFTDPIYGQDEKYPGFDDKLSRDELLAVIRGMAEQLPRVLKPTGSVYLMMSSRYMIDVANILDNVGLYRQSIIPWYESFGPHNPKFWTNRYRAIFHYTRDAEAFTFNHWDTRVYIPSDRLESNDGREDPDGMLPSNVWGAGTDRELARVVGNKGERCPDQAAVNQLPVKLVERAVLISSNPGDVVLDPFHGTGTTARACIPHKRRYIGIDIDPVQVDRSRMWIKALLAQQGAVEA